MTPSPHFLHAVTGVKIIAVHISISSPNKFGDGFNFLLNTLERDSFRSEVLLHVQLATCARQWHDAVQLRELEDHLGRRYIEFVGCHGNSWMRQ